MGVPPADSDGRGVTRNGGGKPEIPAGDYPVIEAKGAFISTLIDMIKENNLEMPPMIGAGFDMPNFKVEDVVAELDEFLTECDKQ